MVDPFAYRYPWWKCKKPIMTEEAHRAFQDLGQRLVASLREGGHVASADKIAARYAKADQQWREYQATIVSSGEE